MAKSLNQRRQQVVNIAKANLTKEEGKQLEDLITKSIKNSLKSKEVKKDTPKVDNANAPKDVKKDTPKDANADKGDDVNKDATKK